MQTAERRGDEQAAVMGGYDKLPVSAHGEYRSRADVLARYRTEEQPLSELPDWFWDEDGWPPFEPQVGIFWFAWGESSVDPETGQHGMWIEKTGGWQKPPGEEVWFEPASKRNRFMAGVRSRDVPLLRPLRRKGATPDVLWDEGLLLVRRSHTETRTPIELTKTAKDQELSLPKDLLTILQWHADRLPAGPRRDSDLLFPAWDGGPLDRACLREPFAEVCTALGLKKKITPRGMRRTFQDLARAAKLHDFVTRAVSGHATATMQEHYSTVSGLEMQEELSKVISLAKVKEGLEAARSAGDRGVHRGVHGHKDKKAG